MKNRNDEIYERSVHEGQKGSFVDDFVESARRLVPILPRNESDKIRESGYDYGAARRKKINNNEHADEEDSNEGSGEFSGNIGGIIVFIIVAYFFYWFLWGH